MNENQKYWQELDAKWFKETSRRTEARERYRSKQLTFKSYPENQKAYQDRIRQREVIEIEDQFCKIFKAITPTDNIFKTLVIAELYRIKPRRRLETLQVATGYELNEIRSITRWLSEIGMLNEGYLITKN